MLEYCVPVSLVLYIYVYFTMLYSLMCQLEFFRDMLTKNDAFLCYFSYIYHRLLEHEVEPQTVHNTLPLQFGVPRLPDLNASQLLHSFYES
jgi:hypothetical protein